MLQYYATNLHFFAQWTSTSQLATRLLGALILWCRGFVPENFLEEAVAEDSSNMVNIV